ncbi:MAG: PEP-CTERM sorting domain-containing protein [Akkermansia sp.]|nr:PEP-CTERM sorting domain-containing protein [Akkermansia sp.]
MRLHLPIALLAVIAGTVAQATMRPELIENVASGETREASEDFMTHVQSQYSSANTYELIGVITKDGQGTLTVSQGYNLNCSLNVREGELYIGNGAEGEHITILAQPHLSDSPTISIGGNNASMVLDNATFKYNVHDSNNRTSYVSAIAIGNSDGAGSLELKNNSVLYTSQSFFAYTVNCQGHVQGTYAGTEGEALYTGGIKGQSSLIISGGSKAQAGITFYFADIDITVDGQGSVFEDGVRNISNYGGWLGDVDGSGSTDVVTNVTIQNGGTWTSRNDLTASAAEGATTNITVTGEGSTFNSERNTKLGYTGLTTTTNLTVTDKAVANITDVTVGTEDGKATSTVTIGEDSTLNAGAVKVYEGGEIINNGAINEGKTEKVLSWRDDSSMGLSGGYAATTETVVAGITLEGGSLENAGSIELDIVMTGGQLTAKDGAVFSDITALGGTINVDGSITMGVLTLGEVENTASGEVAVMTLATAAEADKAVKLVLSQGASINASEVAGLDNADIIITIADYQDGDVLNTGHQYIVGAAADTKVTVVNAKGETFNNVSIATVPEPTTATLSLLALAALAARRRRK